MSRSRMPTYCRHRPSNQAVVTLKLADGTRHTLYLGKWNTSASRKEYARVVGELAVAPTPAGVLTRTPDAGLTVNELAAAFWKWATGYYCEGASERDTYRLVIRTFRQTYGHTRAENFGPLALEAFRNVLISAGLSRGEVNRRVRMAVKVFRWGVARELVPQPVYAALKAVDGLRAGHSPAPDRPRKPVPSHADVGAVLRQVSPTVRAMAMLQLLTGMRPGELVQLRPADIDTTGPVWRFTPATHKNAHRGKARSVALGPKAVAVLAPFTPADPAAFYFNPRAVAESFHADRSARRVVKLWPSHAERNRRKRVRRPDRAAGSRYTTASYSVAIRRGVERENERRERLAGAGNYDMLNWHVHQLRHLAAARLREEFGLETARAALGHSALGMAGHYAASADNRLSERAALAAG